MSLLRQFRQRSFARLYDRVTETHEGLIAEHRRRLCEQVRGTVLELGPGTGANFAHLPQGVRWIGLEPNPYMHERLRERAEQHGLRADIRGLAAERMELEDGSVDVVLSTLVLCSVADPLAVLREVRRVLRPGGRLLFLEHVAAPAGTPMRWMQGVVRPLWRFLCDGCCPDRDPLEPMAAAGFGAPEVEAFRLPVRETLCVAPHLMGSAAR